MSRRNVAILLLAAVLLTAFSLALSRRDSSDWRASRARRIFPFPWQDAASIVLKRPGEEDLSFVKGPGGEWVMRLEADLADSLNPRAVDEFAAFATLAWREPLAGATPPDAAKAVVMTALGVDGQRVDIAFGDAGNNMKAVTVDGDLGTVFGVNQDLVKFLSWPRDNFRNLNLVASTGGRKPRKIVLSPQGDAAGMRIALERGDDGWRQTEPVAWPVDETRLDLLMQWLDRLRAESIQAELAADLEWFGFTPASPFVEVHYPGAQDGSVRRVEFGNRTDDGGLYARVADRNPVFAVPAGMLGEISMDVAADHPVQWKNFYRRRAMSVAGTTLPATIVVERLLPSKKKLSLEQVRERDGVKWRGTLEENGVIRSFAVEPPAAEEAMRPMTALIAGLSSLRVKTFLADAAPGEETMKWTAYPAWRFQCVDAGGNRLPALTVYARDAEGRLPVGEPFVEGEVQPADLFQLSGASKAGMAFSVEGVPAVLEMHGELAYLLCLPLYRYQTRKIADYDSVKWSKVEISSKELGFEKTYSRDRSGVNEQWWLQGEAPAPLMDDNNLFVGLLRELSQLRCDGFVADAGADAVEFGLDRPEITAIVYEFNEGGAGGEKDRLLFKLSVGNRVGVGGDDRFARVNGGGPVFLVPGRLVEAIAGEYR